MILREGPVVLQLGLSGYQFPDPEDQEGDSDWLFVRLRLQHGEYLWERADPALMTFEVQWLVEWLEEVADHVAVFGSWRRDRLTTRIFFTEPCLGFEVLNGYPSGAPMTLRCNLAAEFLPPFREQCSHAATGEDADEVCWISGWTRPSCGP